MPRTELTVKRDQLCFGDGVSVTFQRTLRIPDDGQSYPLPPGLGSFPLRRVDDYLSRVPEEWRGRGGVFLPMYQREAMWICFTTPYWKPRAVKVAVGKICALSGRPWSEELHELPQDYLVTPPQPWLDGIAAGAGFIRQFVAMPLGLGYTVEGQRSGEERVGGIQLKVFEPRPGRFPDQPPPPAPARYACCPQAPAGRSRSSASLGLAAGGRMKQKIYPDPHGLETWDPTNTARVFVHIVTSELWRELTHEAPPPTPVTAREYATAGLPWFDLYDEAAPSCAPTAELAAVRSVKELDAEKSTLPLQDDEPVSVGPVKKLWVQLKGRLGVRDGEW